MTLTCDGDLFQGHSDPLPTGSFFLSLGKTWQSGKNNGLNLEIKDICNVLCI